MTNKFKYFVANWKMFGNLATLKSFKNFKNSYLSLKAPKRNKIILCLPSTLIYPYKRNFKSKHILIGAQNCHVNEKYGPFTGSVSPYMLKDAGAEYVILGHSENRSEGENNKLIKKKIESALKQNLKVIFCIGENRRVKLRKKTFIFLKKQLRESISKKFNHNKIIIAYEPIWSIGTGKVPKILELQKIFKFIKKNFKTKYAPKVLYGGSVNDKNIKKFSSIPDIDGFLIGGASQSSKKFIAIINNYYK